MRTWLFREGGTVTKRLSTLAFWVLALLKISALAHGHNMQALLGDLFMRSDGDFPVIRASNSGQSEKSLLRVDA